MEFKETAQLLLNELAKNVGMDALELDETDYCALITEDETVIHIKFDPEHYSFVVMTAIGHLPEDPTAVLKAVLTANFLWSDTDGGTLALESSSDEIIMQQEFFLENVTSLDLENFLNNFISLCAYWKTRYIELSTGTEDLYS